LGEKGDKRSNREKDINMRAKRERQTYHGEGIANYKRGERTCTRELRGKDEPHTGSAYWTGVWEARNRPGRGVWVVRKRGCGDKQ